MYNKCLHCSKNFTSVFVLVHCLKLLELPAEFGLKDLNDCCSFFHWQRVETCELATSLRRACEWKARDEQQILGMHSSLNEVLQKETPGTCATNVFCSGNLSQFWWIFLEHPEASGPRRAPSCPEAILHRFFHDKSTWIIGRPVQKAVETQEAG